MRSAAVVAAAVASSWIFPPLPLFIVEVLLVAAVLAAPLFTKRHKDLRLAQDAARGALIDAEWALYVAVTDASRRERGYGRH